jgi:hypothetical protein
VALPPWQEGLRVDGLAPAPYLKVQLDRIGSRTALLCNLLARPDPVALLHQQALVVAVGTEVLLVVLDDQQLTEADNAGASVNDHAVCNGMDRIAAPAIDVDALVDTGGISPGNAPGGGPAPGPDRSAHCRRATIVGRPR